MLWLSHWITINFTRPYGTHSFCVCEHAMENIFSRVNFQYNLMEAKFMKRDITLVKESKYYTRERDRIFYFAALRVICVFWNVNAFILYVCPAFVSECCIYTRISISSQQMWHKCVRSLKSDVISWNTYSVKENWTLFAGGRFFSGFAEKWFTFPEGLLLFSSFFLLSWSNFGGLLFVIKIWFWIFFLWFSLVFKELLNLRRSPCFKTSE